jgi:hypothetical protein
MRWVADHHAVICQEVLCHHGGKKKQRYAKGNHCISVKITTSPLQLPAVTLYLLY